MDDTAGGQMHPNAYIKDCGATVLLEDVEFFLENFNALVWRIAGCRLNQMKTRIHEADVQVVFAALR